MHARACCGADTHAYLPCPPLGCGREQQTAHQKKHATWEETCPTRASRSTLAGIVRGKDGACLHFVGQALDHVLAQHSGVALVQAVKEGQLVCGSARVS